MHALSSWAAVVLLLLLVALSAPGARGIRVSNDNDGDGDLDHDHDHTHEQHDEEDEGLDLGPGRRFKHLRVPGGMPEEDAAWDAEMEKMLRLDQMGWGAGLGLDSHDDDFFSQHASEMPEEADDWD